MTPALCLLSFAYTQFSEQIINTLPAGPEMVPPQDREEPISQDSDVYVKRKKDWNWAESEKGYFCFGFSPSKSIFNC